MTRTRHIATAVRAVAVTGLIGSAALGIAATVDGAVVTAASATPHAASVSTPCIRLVSDDEPGDDSADDPAPPPAPEAVDDNVDALPAPEPVNDGVDAQPAPEPVNDGVDAQPAPEPVNDGVDAQRAPEPAPEPDNDDIGPAPADVETPDVAQPSPDAPAPAPDTDPVTVDPAAAPADDIREITRAVVTDITTSEVTQWNSSWTTYDRYYRPVIANPYSGPLSLVYTYGNAPRILTVAPGQRVVIDVPIAGIYDFTAVQRSPQGAVLTVSVGSFTGGGYLPAPGQQPPAKPAPLSVDRNVLTQIRYANTHSAPFRVTQLSDLGDDPAVHACRVLIDGTTSAWGQWGKTPSGEKIFTINEVLQLPGLGTPTQAPLPGYPNIKLVKN